MSDLNAAVRGACAGGATEVLVNDAHGSMLNVMLEHLDERASLISGNNKQDCMMAGLDSSFAGVILLGYHAKDGTPDAVINHSFLLNQIREIRINGRPVGEAGVNAAIAGYHGVPVVLVTGDDKVAAEVGELVPGVRTAIVKYGLDRFVARSLPLAATSKLIAREAEAAVRAIAAVRGGDGGGEAIPKPVVIERPVTFEVEYYATTGPKHATLFPSVRQTGPCTIAVTDEDLLVAFRQVWGCMLLALIGSGGTFR